jgi:hypothetical protein
MKTRGIRYKSGYKYQLYGEFYPLMLPLEPWTDIFDYNRNTKTIRHMSGVKAGIPSHIGIGPFLRLWPNGKMRILAGYAWDGPSGPAFDTNNFMVPSMVHDAIYQLMRNKVLPRDPYREIADEMMYEMCRERGMSSIRAWWCKRGVRQFGEDAATIKKTIHIAP